MNFTDFNLIEPIIQALMEQGYTEPTAIQAGAIPPALKGRDVLGIARTGTGKTCAFAVPILQRLNQTPAEGRPIRALVLTPTRELAIQNQECFEAYGKHLPLRSVVIFGGVGQTPQVEAIQQGADILVATPGRLADLYQQGLIDLSRLEIFVLDEADRMLDMGFIHDVKKILKWLPEKKQTLFFSATMPKEITELVNSLLHKPARIAVDPVNTTVDAIRQQVYLVDRVNKTKLLGHLLQDQSLTSVLVFTRTKHGANKVSRDLAKLGLSSAAIHGNKSQTARQEALSSFKAGKLRVLVATDIAARGLDIEELACVVNYNLPEVPETYVHRIGRTGRAGRGGIAISLCDFQEKPLLKDIEKLTKKTIPVVDGHPWPMENFEAVQRDKHGKAVNPEDEEARAAARAHKGTPSDNGARKKQESPVRELPEQNAKKRNKQAQPKDRRAPADQGAPAVEKAAKKGKKTKKSQPEVIVPIPDLLPKQEEPPVEPSQRFDSSDILHRKYKRPEKKVIPSLSSVSLLPTMELKETFGSRSDMLNQRLNNRAVKLPKLDATSRMFSEKKEIPEAFRPSAPKAKASPEPSAPRGKKPRSAEPSAPKQRQKPAKKSAPEKTEKPAPAENPPKQRKNPDKKKKPLEKKERKAENRVVFTVASGDAFPSQKAGSARKRPKQENKVRFHHPENDTKESGESKSLMKPYYLSDVKK